jgi:hypothetical protein
MPIDARLGNDTILLLAAKRLAARREADAASDWEHTVGLASLLEASRHLPKVEPWDLPDLAPSGGLGRLLAEARAWGRFPQTGGDPHGDA